MKDNVSTFFNQSSKNIFYFSFTISAIASNSCNYCCRKTVLFVIRIPIYECLFIYIFFRHNVNLTSFPACASCTLSIKHVNNRLYLGIAAGISTEYLRLYTHVHFIQWKQYYCTYRYHNMCSRWQETLEEILLF